MRLNKNTTIGFLNNGVYNILKCMYSHKYMGVIPMYISRDIKGIEIIKLRDGSYIIISGEDIYNRCNGKIPDVIIAHSFLTAYFSNDSYRDMLTDIYCSEWFGYNQVITLINNLNLGIEREKQLRNRIGNNEFKVPDIKDLLKNIKCVEVV